MIVMPYHETGDLVNYITSDFYNISWTTKLNNLKNIITGLKNIHNVNINHRDFHSGNIFFGKMEFVPYDRFKDIEFIAEGGFSKIYKATWIDGPIKGWNDQKQSYTRNKSRTVVLKKLNNSKEVTSKELNEVNILY